MLAAMGGIESAWQLGRYWDGIDRVDARSTRIIGSWRAPIRLEHHLPFHAQCTQVLQPGVVPMKGPAGAWMTVF